MKIAIDLDEVLVDYTDSFLKFYNTSYKTDFTKRQIAKYAWWELFDCAKEEIIKIVYVSTKQIISETLNLFLAHKKR